MTPAVANELMGWSIIGAIVVLIVFLATLPLAGKQKPQSRPPTKRREAETKPRTPAREEEQKAREESLTVRPVPAPQAPPPGDRDFYRRQAELIEEVGFYEARRLLNKGEEKIFWRLVAWARENNCRVFPQVALGEVFASDDDQHYAAINAKRADFVLTDQRFRPLALVEYYGSGHWLSDTADARDNVKKAAAESAGLAYIVIRRGQEHRAAQLAEAGLEAAREAARREAEEFKRRLEQLQRIAAGARPSPR